MVRGIGRRTLGAVACAAVVALGAASDARAQEDARMDRLFEQTEQIRGLTFKHRVKVETRTKKELGERMITILDRDVPTAEMRKGELLLKRLDLMPQTADLRATYLAMLTENIAGFYDPKDETLWIISEATGGGEDETVVIHELIHALEDQHFDFKAYDERNKGNDDRALAMSGLIEGSATYGMFQPMVGQGGLDQKRFALRGMGLLLDLSGELQPSGGAPGFLLGSLVYPYSGGLKFLTKLERGSETYARISELFADPPVSTEQVLHPEKYFAARRDEPFERTMPELKALESLGYRKVHESTLGELQMRLAFREWNVDGRVERLLGEQGEGTKAAGKMLGRLAARLVESIDPDKAADGWGGDRFALYENADGATALVLATIWDDEDEAQAFAAAYRRAARSRGRSDVTVELSGASVLVQEGVPEAARAAVESLLLPR